MMALGIRATTVEQLSGAVARTQSSSPTGCNTDGLVQIEEFKAALDDVVEDALGKSPILIAGDFNAWCTDWGSKRKNQRGLILADTLAHLNVCLLNNGSQSTYSMAGRESIIDLTFVSPELARDAAWQVSDIYTHSDHNAVLTELRAGTATRRMQPARHVGYKVSTLNRAILLANVQSISATGDANSCAQKIADCIKTACEASMAKRYCGGSRRNPVPWWNGEISKARAECCAAKRRLQRSRGRSSFESNLMEFRTKRKILRNAITDSKKRCFQELCAAADAEPFGAAYKMVMGKLNKQPMPTCEKTLDTIVRHLFPQQPPLCALVHLPGTTNAVVQTTASEVLDIAANIKPGKAPGPDGIPNSVLKTIIAAHPNVFVDMFNRCLVERTIPYSCSAAVDDIIIWLTNHGLCLAEQKTEAVLISSRKKPQNPAIRIGATTIVTKPAIKYLGLMIDHRLKFKDHLQFASIKAAHATNAISRIMANTRGPRQHSRKLIAGVVTSILLYGSKVWAPAMSVPTYSRDCKAVYRRCALRVACAFRTVSEVAALVVAGMIPLDLLAAERSSGICVNRVQRENTIMQWQTRWLHSVNGSWTRRLIKDIRPWIQRRHGHVDFYICQLLTGHGCFRAYLYRFKHADSPYCDHCRGEVVEDAEHAFFECPLFDSTRRMMMLDHHQLSADNIVDHMLRKEENWNAVGRMAAAIMKELRRRERSRTAD
ncbi:hypothetical protein ACLKA7_010449 [Drosophila subpalustris]